MGFTTIILSPIFVNEKDGYHGYWIHDFYNTDPHFGTLDEFKQLVKEAHKRDMKVMIDFVTNHVGPNHPWLHDAAKKDWFHEKKEVTHSTNRKELETAWIDGLPDLKQENPEVKAYLLDVAKWWMEETNLDGYRLDQVQNVGTDFWRDFVQTVKTEKPDFYLIGDSAGMNIKVSSSYEKTGIDAFMDYRQNEDLRKAFAAPDESLANLLVNQKKNRLTFMDTTQLPRFTFDAVNANQQPGTR